MSLSAAFSACMASISENGSPSSTTKRRPVSRGSFLAPSSTSFDDCRTAKSSISHFAEMCANPSSSCQASNGVIGFRSIWKTAATSPACRLTVCDRRSSRTPHDRSTTACGGTALPDSASMIGAVATDAAYSMPHCRSACTISMTRRAGRSTSSQVKALRPPHHRGRDRPHPGRQHRDIVGADRCSRYESRRLATTAARPDTAQAFGMKFDLRHASAPSDLRPHGAPMNRLAYFGARPKIHRHTIGCAMQCGDPGSNSGFL
jgi:hypothetical protein